MCATVFVPQRICYVLSSFGLALVLLSRWSVLKDGRWMDAKVDDVLDSLALCSVSDAALLDELLRLVVSRQVMPWCQVRQQSSEAQFLYGISTQPHSNTDPALYDDTGNQGQRLFRVQLRIRGAVLLKRMVPTSERCWSCEGTGLQHLIPVITFRKKIRGSTT